MLKKARLLTRPTLARQTRLFPNRAATSEDRTRTLWGARCDE